MDILGRELHWQSFVLQMSVRGLSRLVGLIAKESVPIITHTCPAFPATNGKGISGRSGKDSFAGGLGEGRHEA